MAGNAAAHGGGDASNQTKKLRFNQPLDSVATESSLGNKAMLSFGAVGGVKRAGNLVFSSFDQDEFGDEFLDEYLNQQDKKRRLTADQVEFLERSFKADNKLEPERKVHLANELGLQPRQVAVWFQNRRARWKIKHLETDYEMLRARYEALEADYDTLLKENDKLKAEVLRLKQNSIGGDVKKANSEDEESEVSALAFKNEEQSSAKSEVINADSPRMGDGIHSPLLGATCHLFHPDYSDSSQPEGDFAEDAHHHQPPFYYGFPVEDHAFNFWPY